MPRAQLVRSSDIVRSPRVIQLEGLFDVPPAKRSEVRWSVSLPLEAKPWSIGLIVGPSGCGKTTIARELFGAAFVEGFDWPAGPAGMSIKEITGLLSSVGFSSPPSWLRPFRVLSNGEQFRVTMARALAEQPELAVIDEFTSVVDRTVAQVGSAAISKTIRRENSRARKFVAVSCHHDVIDWLQPDWIYEPALDRFDWRSLQRRPDLELTVFRTDRTAWKIFGRHHYLSRDIARSASCFVGLVDGRPACFTAVMSFPHPVSPSWREHRTVCLPDFQGVGLGNAMSELIASVYRTTGKAYTSVTSHPAMIRHRMKSPLWRCVRPPSLVSSKHVGLSKARQTEWAGSVDRLTSGFKYIGPAAAPELARPLLEKCR